MRELLHEIKQLAKCPSVDLHRDMLTVKNNTMLIVINIRGILKAPGVSLNRYRNNPVVLPGRMIHPSRIPFIFLTEKALGIT